MGAATPVTIDPIDRKMNPADEKVISYFRKEMKATAERNGRPPHIAEAMVDADVVVEGLSEKGKILTLTTTEAVKNKVADLEVSGGVSDVLSAFGLPVSEPVNKNPNWSERFLWLISGSFVSSLLLAIGILGLFLEFKTPTWGVAGTVGLLCLIMFFWGHWALRLVGWEEVVLLAIGTFLLVLETFVIPGFGITGILGFIIVGLAFTLSLVGKSPSASELFGAISHVSIVFICVLIFFFISIKPLAKTRAVQRFVLQKNATPDQKLEIIDQVTDKNNMDMYLNRQGIAFTNLRPAGKGIFKDERLNVVSEGDFIEKGAPIRIIRVQKSNLIVQEIKGEKKS